ncbi:hypothetical protein SAMN04487866_10465 [Thermoactinomyces sp. DSM 45891]|uniref:tRNA uridine-5-carboxymethylaminomethyl(34) synthesis enzyme MnmG n=1 Tax=Thermoactinomyces sp. DSM 45891 TaxID=1761907 RepID=UPI00091D3C3A|nr:tRNA uridine-5-carboxymethylaminomethyl(34) synthesis enzyme MnmG [Thermoactinomyces sp. DSM 45891]SFX31046.1 hypothetical protein SAMN04487866_10465 [Thermoactinomyces sp. DSM 45891]
MSHLEQFDVIILGSREKAEQAILASEQQGQKVLLIDLDLHVTTSLICQETLSTNVSLSKDHKIVAHKQEVHTPLHKTTTFVFQTELVTMEEQTSDKAIEDIFLPDEQNNSDLVATPPNVSSSYLEVNDDLELKVEDDYFDPIEEFDPALAGEFDSAFEQAEDQPAPSQQKNFVESVEADDQDDLNSDPKNQPESILPSLLWNRENSLKDRLTREHTKTPAGLQSSLTSHLFDRIQPSDKKTLAHTEIDLKESHPSLEESDTSVESISDIPDLEETTSEAVAFKSVENQNQDTEFVFSFHKASKEPHRAYKERDIRLRKKFSQSRQHKPSPDSFEFFSNEPEQGSDPKESIEQVKVETPKPIKPSNLVSLTLLEKPKDTQKTTYLEDEIGTPDTSFAPRRRSRTQKKSRLFQNIDLNAGKDTSKELKKKSLETKGDHSPFDLFSFSPEGDLSTGKSSHHVDNKLLHEKENDPNPLASQQNNGLKADEIEFEDAYGYNSWEEFLTPISQNSRKRQELDQIEKRKLALRGLHNLIDNLG